MSKNLKQRSEIDNRYKWNIENMYSDEKTWEIDLKSAIKTSEEFQKYHGKLIEGKDTLISALNDWCFIWQKIEKVFVYSRMKKDEDNRNDKYQSMLDKAEGSMSKISTNLSFFIPELLSIDDDTLLNYIATCPDLKVYEFMIKNMLREKPHILSASEESILAQMGELNHATNNIFTMLNNADMKFGSIQDEKGAQVPLTHGNYISFMESHNRTVRKTAYEKMYNEYEKLINTISTTYNFNTKTDVVSARIRKYPSSRDAALYSDNIDAEIYDNLVQVINDNLHILHKYMKLRKKVLGVEQLQMYDVYVPLVELPKKKISFEKAKEIMSSALTPLGKEYISDMSNGLNAGWVDVYENEGKTSGAYSFGSYDSMPYILMNYSHTLKDVFTLAHEMGHSMHSFYTRKTQPFIYGSHSIFTAEVASTVNENLLMNYLTTNETDPIMKKYLLNYHIEEFRTTVFRQTMFAEFEDWTHRSIENGETLTAQSMCEYYKNLNKKYFGETLADDDLIKYEWSRIPHFYNAFYVYKYATGFSAATAISDIVLNEGPSNYLKFLSTGDSNHPIELLKIAGVDMGSKKPIEKAMEVFAKLVDEFEQLV